MNTIKGFKIHSAARQIIPMEVENTLEALYKTILCEMIETAPYVALKPNNVLLVDEEGKLNGNDGYFFAKMRGDNARAQLVGNGFVCGFDHNSGDWSDTTMTQ